MAVPVLGSETWMLRGWNRIYAAEMKYKVALEPIELEIWIYEINLV
jgi:hypothetical protein